MHRIPQPPTAPLDVQIDVLLAAPGPPVRPDFAARTRARLDALSGQDLVDLEIDALLRQRVAPVQPWFLARIRSQLRTQGQPADGILVRFPALLWGGVAAAAALLLATAWFALERPAPAGFADQVAARVELVEVHPGAPEPPVLGDSLAHESAIFLEILTLASNLRGTGVSTIAPMPESLAPFLQ